jgi:hypothetical protein
MSNTSATPSGPSPSAASRRWAQSGPRDEALAAQRRQRRPRAPLTPAERTVLDELLGDSQPHPAGQTSRRHGPQPAPPADSTDLPAVALLLHTVVPPATDHAYRKHASPASTASHLAGHHRLDPGGEHARLLAEQFTDPDQLHRFAHEPTEQRAILGLLLDPVVDQILDLLGQLPSDLRAIVLAEAALATRLLDPAVQPASRAQPADDPLPTGGGLP